MKQILPLINNEYLNKNLIELNEKLQKLNFFKIIFDTDLQVYTKYIKFIYKII